MRLLAIAGSDSSGGAGIQADIKTASALGAYAMTAITAITAQDTTAIGTVYPIPSEIVAEQIARCLSDIGADAIKTGMMGSAATVGLVARMVQEALTPLVVDPVLIATRGAILGDESVLAALRSHLVPGASLVTPNLPEAARLCGFALQTSEDVLRAGQVILDMGAKAVLIKGGHGVSDTVTDLLFVADQSPRAYIARRVDTPHTHGTGCTLSTAIACGLGEGKALGDAVQRAHDFVQRAIRTAPGLGHGNGPINLLPLP